MKRILTHILAFFFLLFFAGFRLLDISQNNDASYATAKIVQTHRHSVKAVEHKITKESHTEYAFSSIETDLNDFDFSDQLVLLATFTKFVVFAFIVCYLLKRLNKRRFFYEAYIRIFSHKYLVLRTLRI